MPLFTVKGVSRLIVAMALLAAITVGVGPPSSAAAVVVVTTTADTVAADGLVSLREAVDMANSDGDDTVIQLGSGLTYQLTICVAKEPVEIGNSGFFRPPDDDDANLDGDLDHTEANDLTIEGDGSTISNTCEFDRVIDNLDPMSRLVLDDLTVRGGDDPPDLGTNLYSLGGATLTDVTVTDSVSDLGSQQAAVVVGDGDNISSPGNRFTAVDSSFLVNQPSAVRVQVSDALITGSLFADNAEQGVTVTFGTLDIEDTSLIDNGQNGVSGIDAQVNAVDVVAGGNGRYGLRTTGNADSGQALVVSDSRIVANLGGGLRCSNCTDLEVTDSTVILNEGTGVSMTTNVVGPTMAIDGSTIADNTGGTNAFGPNAGGVEMEADGVVPTVTIERSTITGNEAGSGSPGGGIRMISADLELSFVTLVENTSSGGGANLDVGADDLTSAASVIALPSGGANCVVSGSVTSLGFNQADDLSCGFGGAPGDVAPAPNPLLESLTDNGGPTPTRVPQLVSPLVGVVTGPLCTGVDQRGLARPQGQACEVGAVEIDETPQAVLVSGGDPLPNPDKPLRDWLIDRGYGVTVLDDDDLGPAEIAALDDVQLVLVSSSVVPAKVGTSLNGVTAPVLSNEGFLFDDLGIATAGGQTAATTNVVVLDPSSGYDGYVSVLTAARPLSFGLAVPSADVVAASPGGMDGQDPVAFVVDAGDPLADASLAIGPRGAFLFSYSAPPKARAAAFDLLDHVHDLLMS